MVLNLLTSPRACVSLSEKSPAIHSYPCRRWKVTDSFGIVPGLVAGFFMGLCSEIGYRLNIFRSSLIYIDGTFFTRTTGITLGRGAVYGLGVIIHLFTSAAFGVGYALLVMLLRPEMNLVLFFGGYMFLLYLAMLVVALPVAGQGFLGRRLGRFTWLEQLIVHIIYGIAFIWAM